MIIECSNCHARYQYDEDRFDRKPSKKIKCAKCGTVFEIHNPAFADKPATNQPGERTYTKKAAPKVEEKTAEASVPKAGVDAEGKPAAPQLPSGKRLSLAIINGADAGSVYRIEKPRVVIGRTGADLNLNDTEASRNHAAIEIRDTTYMVEDLNSTNGTIFDGQKITSPVELQNHSEFQIGSTTIMLIVTDDV